MPFIVHLKSLFEHSIADGIVPLIVDGYLYLSEDKRKGVIAEEIEPGLKRLITNEQLVEILNAPTGDPWFDELTRRIETGDDDFENPFA